MPRGIPNDPAALARKVRRWARLGNIGRLRMALMTVWNISQNPFYSLHARYKADEVALQLTALLNLISAENDKREDTETG